MSHYGKYIMEREGKEILEDEDGFATFLFTEAGCYIVDIYVVPEKRKEGVAKRYADEIAVIAEKENVKRLIGSVDVTTNSATDSAKVLLAYGMKLGWIDGNMIYFTKEL